MMVTKKGFASLPLNVLYGYLLLALVILSYNGINRAYIALFGATDQVPVGWNRFFSACWSWGGICCCWP